ncbi:sigma-70 family RNA polymerase sigma factor [Streptomyces sp. HC44]|uniref:Sigma-70 family RNA polymerase sigma factor n=1 Tax=Streptomyces scabichelini TaxID=2711217 RepID=A0A6G4VJJ4_9ACTN|nr:sigma-70 family RNA polymerase sigma factor [Streptomyces scabichelini]NGO14332.1 sigma-70 family RNA polymerase sigma factor [Streptomyces scabichelini]
MHEHDGLAELFEAHRGHLRAVAARMLGSLSDADDAVQETWLRLSRTEVAGVDNLAGWLRTVVSRICLDMLRSRTSRREEPLDRQRGDGLPEDSDAPEDEVLRVDSVGRALLVVLDTLSPAERVAFVLHDLFAVPFAQIAPVLDRSEVTTKKLASRARHKVRGTPADSAASAARHRHRHVVEAFLAAARTGDLDGLLAVLAPDVVRRADPAVLPSGAPTEIRGADAVARNTTVFGRPSRFGTPALVNGTVGIVVAPRGRLRLAIRFTFGEDGRITAYEVIGEPERLRELSLGVLNNDLRRLGGAPTGVVG